MGYRQVTLNGAIKKKSDKERVIHLSELRNYVNIFYGNSILMKRERERKYQIPPKNYKVMKRFPEGHIPPSMHLFQEGSTIQ